LLKKLKIAKNEDEANLFFRLEEIMELDAITSSLVERTLRNLQQAKEIASDWQRAHFLEEGGAVSPVELRYRLYDHLSEVVQEALTRHRRDAGIASLSAASPSQQQLKAALAADFSGGRSSLEAWSALHYRYLALSGSDLSRDELAESRLELLDGCAKVRCTLFMRPLGGCP
jgi:hypothetical protein